MDKSPAGIQCLKVSGNKNEERREENEAEKHLSCRYLLLYRIKGGCKKVAEVKEEKFLIRLISISSYFRTCVLISSR